MDPGGAKKFLYSGTKRQAEAEEEEQWTFSPKGQDDNNKPGASVDLNDVWSIQRNVSLGGLAPRAADRLTHNASKGFYSRHGGMKVEPAPFTHPWRPKYIRWPFMSENGKGSKPADKPEMGTTWAPARVSSFSYSFTGNAVGDDTSSIASSRVSRGYHSNPSPRRFDNPGGTTDENDF